MKHKDILKNAVLDHPSRHRKISKTVSISAVQIVFLFTLTSCRHVIDKNIDLGLKDTISIVPARWVVTALGRRALGHWSVMTALAVALWHEDRQQHTNELPYYRYTN